MQKINAQISLLFNREGLHLQVFDNDANVQFLEIYLNQDQTCDALSRLARTKCMKCEVNHLDKVGLVREMEKLEFEIPSDSYLENRNRHNTACEIAKKVCPKGWTPELYFDSQDSFFFKDNKTFAKTSRYRWVKKDEKVAGRDGKEIGRIK